MTFAELVNLINQKVLSGGARTKANGMREVLTEIAREATNDDGRIEELQDDVSTLQSSVTSLDSRLDTAETDIDNLQAAATSLDSRLDTAESDIDNLQAADTALDSRLDTLEGQNLDSRLSSAESTITDHETRIDDLEAASGDYIPKTGSTGLTGDYEFGSLDKFKIYNDGYAEAKYNSSTYSRMTSSELLVTNSSSSNTQAPLYQQFTDIATGFWQKIQRAASVFANATFYLPATGGTLATQEYVDNVAIGLRWKAPVVVATTANITLSGTQTIDGIAVVAGNRVLVKNQSTGSQNGIYVCASGSWTRSTDADSATELEGAAVFVQKGSANADKAFVQTADDVTLGTTSLVWSQFSGSTTPLASSSDVNTGADSASAITPSALQGSLYQKGPASSATGNILTFSDTTGKNTQDSGVSLNTSSDFSGSSSTVSRDDKTKTYIDNTAIAFAIALG